ncbi:TPA: hypothetical protein DCX16_04135 [bacterium]|nr:hypothetical protein [bacterium]
MDDKKQPKHIAENNSIGKKVFISSTCFDLKDLRAELAVVLEEWGYTPLWSESPNFPKESGLHAHDICLEVVKECDIYLLIIDKKYGSIYAGNKYPRKGINITQYEAEIAFEKNTKVCTFVRDEVWNERLTYKENLSAGTKIRLHHADDPKIFDFIDFIAQQPKDNWIETFRDSVELKEKLKTRLSTWSTEEKKLIQLSLHNQTPPEPNFVGREDMLETITNGKIGNSTPSKKPLPNIKVFSFILVFVVILLFGLELVILKQNRKSKKVFKKMGNQISLSTTSKSIDEIHPIQKSELQFQEVPKKDKKSQVVPQTTIEVTVTAPKEKVAVLPFKNFTGDNNLDYLGKGIADLITSGLLSVGVLHHCEARMIPPVSIVIEGRPNFAIVQGYDEYNNPISGLTYDWRIIKKFQCRTEIKKGINPADMKEQWGHLDVRDLIIKYGFKDGTEIVTYNGVSYYLEELKFNEEFTLEKLIDLAIGVGEGVTFIVYGVSSKPEEVVSLGVVVEDKTEGKFIPCEKEDADIIIQGGYRGSKEKIRVTATIHIIKKNIYRKISEIEGKLEEIQNKTAEEIIKALNKLL